MSFTSQPNTSKKKAVVEYGLILYKEVLKSGRPWTSVIAIDRPVTITLDLKLQGLKKPVKEFYPFTSFFL